ncbi:MAG: STAS domain-containing protein [Clostridiales bacterium]|nr:STAS domain-containing protein [Clostridiales bacterium]
MRGMLWEKRGDRLIIHLPEELDHHTSQKIARETESPGRMAGVHRIVFDYTRTQFMDSAGVGTILGYYKRMQKINGDITIYGASRRVLRLLEIAGIHKLVKIYDSEADAIGEDKKNAPSAERR